MTALGPFLEALVVGLDVDARRAADPVHYVHRYEERGDQEVAAVFASALAFGRVAAFSTVLDAFFAIVDTHGGPARAARVRPPRLQHDLEPLLYRWIRGPHLWALLGAVGGVQGSIGLEAAQQQGTAKAGLSELADRLRGEVVAQTGVPWASQPRGLRFLVPRPNDGAACKRWCMFHRWMVRRADGIDLGLWQRNPATLVIPVDTHVHRVARFLGLTERPTASWRTAEEITAALALVDPSDPVRFDFALAHLGISGDCRGSRHPPACRRCPLDRVCRAS